MFKDKGYKIVKNIIPHALLDKMIYVIAERFTSITNIHISEKILSDGEVSKELEEKLTDLRTNEPEKFGYLYDSIQSSVSLHQLLTFDKLISEACEVTGQSVEFVSTSGHIQRIDPPEDSRNLYSWHQETSYYRQNETGEGCFFIWIPLFDVNPNNGAIIIAEGSHRNGYVKTEVNVNETFGSEQRTIENSLINNHRIVQPELEKGDACIVDFNTIHKSGNNLTDLFRYTAIGRYHHTNTIDFKPFRYKFIFNELVL